MNATKQRGWVLVSWGKVTTTLDNEAVFHLGAY